MMKSLLFELQPAAEELVLCARMKSPLFHPSAPDPRADLIPFPVRAWPNISHAGPRSPSQALAESRRSYLRWAVLSCRTAPSTARP